MYICTLPFHFFFNGCHLVMLVVIGEGLLLAMTNLVDMCISYVKWINNLNSGIHFEVL